MLTRIDTLAHLDCQIRGLSLDLAIIVLAHPDCQIRVLSLDLAIIVLAHPDCQIQGISLDLAIQQERMICHLCFPHCIPCSPGLPNPGAIAGSGDALGAYDLIPVANGDLARKEAIILCQTGDPISIQIIYIS
jgi:hypothetical protein